MKAALLHVITYLICGLVFSSLLSMGNVKYFMRDTSSTSSLIGPLVQIFRGILTGGILYLIKDSIFEKKAAFLRLWTIVAGLGIICTYAPAPFSIEGFVYSQMPLEFQLKIAPELLVQTLLFSFLMTKNFQFKISEKYRQLIIILMIAGVGFSISGILLALTIGADFMESATDLGAYLVMLAALLIIFFITRLYLKKKSRTMDVLYYPFCYIVLAGLPTLYNYLSDSPLKSPLSLVFSCNCSLSLYKLEAGKIGPFCYLYQQYSLSYVKDL